MTAATSADEAALIRAVLLSPGDDLPRLVLADWLDERGQGELAEFVRVQCELAKMPPQGPRQFDPRYMIAEPWESLRRRERELLDENWSRWIRGAGLVPDGWKLSTDGDSFHVWRDVPFDDGFRFQFRRGFVAEVRAPLATLFGGECENCGGFGEFRRRHDNGDGPEGPCPDCGGKWNSGPHDDTDSYWDRGTGRTPGVAADLFARHPVEAVTLVWREPHESPFVNQPDRCRWVWVWNEADPDNPSSLPWMLYSKLRIRSVRDGGHDWAGFPTRAAALAALSRACVALGRERAGLPQ